MSQQATSLKVRMVRAAAVVALGTVLMMAAQLAITYLGGPDAEKQKGVTEVGQIAGAPEVMEISIARNSNVFREIPQQAPHVNNLVEIKLKNSEGQPINMSDHLKQEGVVFPAEVQATQKDLVFYIFEGPNDLGVSQAIVLYNNEATASNSDLLRKWEPRMSEDLKRFILIGEQYDMVRASGNNNFETSDRYKNTRYINFSEDGAVSLNYTAGEGYMIITNSYSIQGAILKKLSPNFIY